MKSDGDPYYCEIQPPEEFAIIRSKPPFPHLPSFIISAIILSFFGCQDYVKDVMQRLSKKTRGYYIAHKDKINSFAVQFEPELTEITFGQEIYDYDNKFPY